MTSWASILIQTCGNILHGFIRDDKKSLQACHCGRSISAPANKTPLETTRTQQAEPADLPRPEFNDLPLAPNHPKASAWGLWGKNDELGTLNLLIPEVVSQASSEIRLGQVIPLK
jgi:hypothetical protein